MTYRLCTLGELRLDGPGGEVRALRRKDRLLLAFLARATGPVARAELATLLWGRSDDGRARQSLRQSLFALRRELGDGLDVGPESVRLRPGAMELDLASLESAVAAGRPREALSLWCGDFLRGHEDAGDEPLRLWIEGERASLRSLIPMALDALVAAAPGTDDREEVVELLRRWTDASPGDEAAHLRLVVALRDAGRLEEALAWHSRAVARLREELGREPTAGFLAEAGALALLLERRRVDAPVPPRIVRAPAEQRTAFRELLDVWQGVRAGGSSVVRVVAPDDRATPFVHDLVTAIEAAGPVFVLRLSVGPDDGAGDWASAARLLAPIRSAPGLSGVADAALAEVAELVPSIRARFPRLPRPVGGAAVLARAATETIRDVAAEVPVLVAIDGADRCDPETRGWLALLAERKPPSTMLVVAAPAGAFAGPDGAAGARPRTVVLTEESAAAGPPGSAPTGPARRPGRATRVRAVVAALATAFLVSTVTPATRAAPSPPILAVGSVRALAEAIGEPSVMAMPELLSTQLARVAGLTVVSRGRMQELLAQEPGELAAARAAGATHLLEGELFWRDGRHHLEIRRLDARTGRVDAVHTADAENPLDLAHGVAAAVAVSLGHAAPTWPDSGPTSVAARALYEAGLQAFYHRQDHRTAFRLFSAAVDEDPRFAMAALFAARSAAIVEGGAATTTFLAMAEAAADDAPERDRLYIRASVALHFNDPSGLQAAELLVARYPAESAGPILLGHFLAQAGRFAGAARQFRRALAMQTSAGAARAAACRACDAYGGLVGAYWFADSLDAAIRTAAQWAELQPDNPDPLTWLSALHMVAGHDDQAVAARQRAARITADQGIDVLWTARHAIHRGDFAGADAGLEYLVGASSNDVARRATWLHVISLRHQRRWEEAWQAASRYRELAAAGAEAVHPNATPQAVVLMETGRAARAAAMFDTMFHTIVDLGRDSRTARDRAWLLTLRAMALAVAGDTASLPRLADEVQRLGGMTSYGRDARLHHHIRGLLLRARGDLAGAEREFRAAIYSTTAGFTRTNVELARVLIDLGRPEEARPLLEATLRAPIDGPALYVTRTEVLQLLDTAVRGESRGLVLADR